MIGLFIVFFIFAVVLPVISGASQDDTDPDKVKVLVDNEAVYHFQEITALKETNDRGLEEEERLTSTVQDPVRLYTKRLWYSYGHDTSVPRPLVGYLPYAGSEKKYVDRRRAGLTKEQAHRQTVNEIENISEEFYNKFQSDIHPRRHGNYFDYRSRPKPEIFICSMTTPKLYSEALEEMAKS